MSWEDGVGESGAGERGNGGQLFPPVPVLSFVQERLQNLLYLKNKIMGILQTCL